MNLHTRAIAPMIVPFLPYSVQLSSVAAPIKARKQLLSTQAVSVAEALFSAVLHHAAVAVVVVRAVAVPDLV